MDLNLSRSFFRGWRKAVMVLACVALLGGCDWLAGLGVSGDRNDLNAMDKATVTIKGTSFEVWLAADASQRELGLMQVTQEELNPLADGTERGMLFVFDAELVLSFWMLNTIIPLDIAYIRADGQIVRTYTMAALETRSYTSVEPVLYALEVSDGLFAKLGIGPGDHVEIPQSLLKAVP